MASSTARAAPRLETITPARIEQMQAAITTLQAQGAEVTAAAVHRLVHGHRRTVQVYVKAWREQQRQAAAVAPCPVAPAPSPPPPVSHLRALRQRVAQLEADARTLERAQQQLQQQLAESRAAARLALLEARRLVRDCRQAQQQAGSAAYLMQPEMVARTAQLRQRLVELVGEEETVAVLTDYWYTPSWMVDVLP